MNASFLWSDFPEAADIQKWNTIREWRGRLLSACDWTQLSDAPLTLEEKQAWSAYRQALRDLPQNYATPDDVDFPETP